MAFVVGRTKAKKRSIAPLKGVEKVPVTSTKEKLEVLQKHYQHLGRVSGSFYMHMKSLILCDWVKLRGMV